MKPTTIEEIQAQLDLQNAELAELMELAAGLGEGLPETMLREIEEATELPVAAQVAPYATDPLPLMFVRA